MKVKYKVTIGSKSTNVIVGDTYKECYGDDEVTLDSDDFSDKNHNFDGRKGIAVNKAIVKLFGKNCFLYRECSNLYRGQVFEALKPSKYNSNPGNSSRTSIVCLDIEEI